MAQTTEKPAEQAKERPAVTAGRDRRPHKVHSSKNIASLTAADRRYREVVRSRVILGCIIAAIILVTALAFFLPRLSARFYTVNKGTLVGVNDDVLQYADAVSGYCREYGIAQYDTLLMALMQQESSGQGTDIFQCSESPFNTEYPNTPGSIADTDYSIKVGVETFAYCLEEAGCKSIADTDRLKIALQEYNFGNDYAGWALANYGGYSEENALAFSEKMKAELGWSSYGDPQYVQHVLQYIRF